MGSIDLSGPITEDERREAELVSSISMLSIETLARLRRLVMNTSGPVLEIGTYIGGATILLSRAIADRGHGRLICVEAGGQHLDHPTIPSHDILEDWRSNISAANLRETPRMIKGFAWNLSIICKITKEIGNEKVTLIVIDADGFPELTLVDLEHVLSHNCYTVIDDYETSSAGKAPTRWQVDHAISEGSLEGLGVFPYGTWFGRKTSSLTSYRLGLINSWRVGIGHAEHVPLRTCKDNWQLREIGREEFMRRASVDEVQETGDGRYCLVVSTDRGIVIFAPPRNPENLKGCIFELRRP